MDQYELSNQAKLMSDSSDMSNIRLSDMYAIYKNRTVNMMLRDEIRLFCN